MNNAAASAAGVAAEVAAEEKTVRDARVALRAAWIAAGVAVTNTSTMTAPRYCLRSTVFLLQDSALMLIGRMIDAK